MNADGTPYALSRGSRARRLSTVDAEIAIGSLSGATGRVCVRTEWLRGPCFLNRRHANRFAHPDLTGLRSRIDERPAYHGASPVRNRSCLMLSRRVPVATHRELRSLGTGLTHPRVRAAAIQQRRGMGACRGEGDVARRKGGEERKRWGRRRSPSPSMPSPCRPTLSRRRHGARRRFWEGTPDSLRTGDDGQVEEREVAVQLMKEPAQRRTPPVRRTSRPPPIARSPRGGSICSFVRQNPA